MIDETQGPGSELPEAGETSLGGASEWSTVPPSSAPTPPAAPTPALEPLPQPASYPSIAAPTGPPVPPQPPSGPAPAPAGQHGYQPVYGTGQQAPPNVYASAPGGGFPPPPQTPPPGYTGVGGPPPGYPPPPPTAGQGLSSHAAAAISYITFIPAVIFLVMAPYNRDRFVRFHAWQCIALTIVWVVISIIFTVLAFAGLHFFFGMWTLIHMLIRLVLFVLWLIAIIKASQGQWFKIPVIGDLAQNFAGKDA